MLESVVEVGEEVVSCDVIWVGLDASSARLLLLIETVSMGGLSRDCVRLNVTSELNDNIVCSTD